MFKLINKILIGLLTDIVSASNHENVSFVEHSKMYDSTYSY